MERIMLLSFVPINCPDCGEPIKVIDTSDFFSGCAHVCLNCELNYQYVDAGMLLGLADKTGDMGSYVGK
jgi:hypothetical protein